MNGSTPLSKPGADNDAVTGRNGQSRRSRNRGNNSNPTKKTDRFTGLNKSELQGIVICDELQTPTSRQYDLLYDALIVYGGSKNPQVRTALKHLKPIEEKSLEPPKPKKDEYLGEDGQVDEVLRTALMSVWSSKADRASKLYSKYRQELEALFGTICGQLSKNIRDTLESDDSWDEIDEANDTIQLLKLLRTVCYRENHVKVNPGLDLLSKVDRLINSKQDPSKSLGEYVDEVKIRFDVVKASGGRIVSPGFTKYAIDKIYKGKSDYSYDKYSKLSNTNPEDIKMKKEIDAAVDQAMLGLIIIKGSNDRLHRDLRQTLQDSFARGHDDYPISSVSAQDMLNQYKNRALSGTMGRKPAHNGNRARNNPSQSKESKESSDSDSPKPGRSEATQFVAKGTRNSDASEPTGADSTSSDKDAGVVCVINGSKKKKKTNVDFCFAQISTPPSRGQAPSHTPSVNRAYLFATQHEDVVNRNWILLDSQATCNVICNKNLLKNIRRHPDGDDITIHCNAGNVIVNHVGTLPGFGTVWFHPKGIANCLSLAHVSDKYRVTLDTNVAQAFFVHKPDGTTRRFDRVECGLYACDITQSNGVVLPIVTVDGQKKQYSELDVKRATAARKLQDVMGFPSLHAFLKMIDNNLILNSGVTRRDILIAEDIFGVNVAAVKGKTTRRQPGHVREDITEVPRHILKNYGNVTLSIDVYHVNGIKFFRSISRHLMFRMTTAIKDATQETLFDCIKVTHALYKKRGFLVTQIHGDNEFVCLTDRLLEDLEIVFHPVARGSHDPYIERDNRTSKERARCMFHSVPFKRMPPRMIIEMIIAVDYWLNSWCSKGGVSHTIPPRQIITGIKLDAKRHCKFQFGDYLLPHEGTDNTMKARADDAIFLRPTGHPNGGFYVFCLHTARRVHRRSATLAHMTDTVINTVHAIAEQQKAPIGMTFSDYHNTSTILDIETDYAPDDDDASDASYRPEWDDVSTDSDMTGFISESDSTDLAYEDDSCGYAGDEEESAIRSSVPPNDAHTTTDFDAITRRHTMDEGSINSRDGVIEFTNDNHAEDDHSITDGPKSIESEGVGSYDDSRSVNSGMTSTGDNEEDDPDHHDSPVLRRSRRIAKKEPAEIEGPIHKELRPHLVTPSAGTALFSVGFSRAVAKLEREHTGFMFVAAAVDQYNSMEASKVTPQYHVSKGLKIFGEPGVDAVMKELKQLHNLHVISPCRPDEMTREEVKRALPYLMFLKRKRCGRIKGRGCADGRSQREFISKDEASSPTVSLHALFLTCIVDAIERRDVATVDIPGAFLQTPMPDDEDPVHIKLTGKMVRLLASLDPDTYGPCIVPSNNGGVTMYAKANKAIYGTLKAALLFWNKLSSKLQEWGFEPNPYDVCTVNKIINGSQATIVWHVDDLKISHKEPKVVDEIIDDLRNEFGKIAPLTENRGVTHDYLGMQIDYGTPGKVTLSMFDYLEDIIANLPDDLKTNRISTSPAASHLFDVNPESPKLKHDRAEMFHHYVAKLLFASKRARPDIQTAVAFLCTRVQQPDEDDWKKLVRLLGYLKDTIFLPLVLGDDGTGNLYWYVDASFAVHQNMRSHTGGMLTLGHGAAISVSTKQKINTKSSTEAELVGVDDCLPFNIWCSYFLKHQGCEIHENVSSKPKYLGHRNILYQDNTSSIKLETNGKASSTKRTRHINIRYFMVTDRVKKGEIEIEYCPTEEMLADYFTKPVQGSLFRKFRNAIMGITDADYLRYKGDYYAAKARKLSVPSE